jgi:hypothetical protein
MSSESSAPTTMKTISWIGYRPLAWDDFSSTSKDVFRGVIHYIHFNSGNLYNRGELILEYSSKTPQCDPAHIFDSNSEECFESGSGLDECFAITFHRVSVRPFAITIRSGRSVKRNPLPWSFIFQGWNSNRQTWETLTERTNEIRIYGNWRGYAIDTPSAFRKFRFVCTGNAVPGLPNFSFAAFEIHGSVFPDEEEAQTWTDQERVFDPVVEDGEFDPWSIAE